MNERSRYLIRDWSKLTKVKVRIGSGEKLTFHTYSNVRRGDSVLVLDGMFKSCHGRVLRTWSFWKGYTYECIRVGR